MSKVSTRRRNTDHKHDVEIPINIEEANKLDAKNGRDFW